MIDRVQRECWRQERERRDLVPGRPGFGCSGLMGNLDEARLLVTTLPSDPLRPALDFDDAVLTGSVLPQRFTGQTSAGVSLLGNVESTSDALVRYATGGGTGMKWRGFASVRRDGGVDIGIGSVARFEYSKDSVLANLAAYRLFVLVHAVRVAIETQARLLESRRDEDLSPFELIVAVPGAGGSLVDGLAEGWERPEYAFEASLCLQQDPLVRTEVASWPIDPTEQETLLLRVATRICDAFNVRNPLFVARAGDSAGRLSPSYA